MKTFALVSSLALFLSGCGTDDFQSPQLPPPSPSSGSALLAAPSYGWQTPKGKSVGISFLTNNGQAIYQVDSIFTQARQVRMCSENGGVKQAVVKTCCGHDVEGSTLVQESATCFVLKDMVFANSKYKLAVTFADGEIAEFTLPL